MSLADSRAVSVIVVGWSLALFVVVAMSSIGLPTTNGFVGEFMIIAGAFMSEMLGKNGPIAATVAATGVILAAIFGLIHGDFILETDYYLK